MIQLAVMILSRIINYLCILLVKNVYENSINLFIIRDTEMEMFYSLLLENGTKTSQSRKEQKIVLQDLSENQT